VQQDKQAEEELKKPRRKENQQLTEEDFHTSHEGEESCKEIISPEQSEVETARPGEVPVQGAPGGRGRPLEDKKARTIAVNDFHL
jgi:hypothetical protein